MRWLFLALAFAAELAAWAAIGFATARLTGRWWLGLLATAVAIVAWGLLAAPNASAPRSAALATKIVVFGGAVVLLLLARHWGWAIGVAVLILVAHVGVALTPGD